MCLKLYANHLKGFQVMETVNLQCNSLSQRHSFQAENSMKGGAYMGEVLKQIWHERMNELLDTQVNV